MIRPSPDIKRTQRSLLRWFDVHRRDLPWRKTTDPYLIWLSEVMLQQTQVVTVIPYWNRFREKFPTVADLATASLDDVLSMWKGLGYYTRARNLHRAARVVHFDLKGAFPQSATELIKLPGFGRYTAGAVASIAFGEPVALVDGNVARVLSRVYLIAGLPGDRQREKDLWAQAEQLAQHARPGDVNQSIMELGALICKVDQPLCLICPLVSGCKALREGRVSEFPPPKVRQKRTRLSLAVAVWRRKGKLLFAKRNPSGLFGGLWELPCVFFEGAEEDLEGAFSQLFQVPVRRGRSVGLIKRTLTHRDLELHLFSVSGRRLPKVLEGYSEWGWLGPGAYSALGMSTAMQKAVAVAVVE